MSEKTIMKMDAVLALEDTIASLEVQVAELEHQLRKATIRNETQETELDFLKAQVKTLSDRWEYAEKRVQQYKDMHKLRTAALDFVMAGLVAGATLTVLDE